MIVYAAIITICTHPPGGMSFCYTQQQALYESHDLCIAQTATLPGTPWYLDASTGATVQKVECVPAPVIKDFRK